MINTYFKITFFYESIVSFFTIDIYVEKLFFHKIYIRKLHSM